MQVALPPYEAVNSFFDPESYEAATMIIRSPAARAAEKLIFVMLLSLAAGIQTNLMDDDEDKIIVPEGSRPN